MQNEFRVRSVWPNHTAGALQFSDESFTAIKSRVRGNPKTPIEACRLAFAGRFARGPQHCMTQPDRTIHPALAGIRATVREKIYKGLQKRPLHRRTVPVVDADDAAQSACLPIRVAGASDDKRNGPAGISARMDGIPFRLDIRPLAEFSCDENSIPTLLGWGVIVLSALSRSNRATTGLFCLATPQRSRHSTGA
jgi:hypothetical protein